MLRLIYRSRWQGDQFVRFYAKVTTVTRTVKVITLTAGRLDMSGNLGTEVTEPPASHVRPGLFIELYHPSKQMYLKQTPI